MSTKKKITKRSKNAKHTKQAINKNMTFAEIMEKHPEMAGELFQSGMHCFGCAMAGSETLEQGAMAHGMNADELVKKLNKRVQKKNSKK